VTSVLQRLVSALPPRSAVIAVTATPAFVRVCLHGTVRYHKSPGRGVRPWHDPPE